MDNNQLNCLLTGDKYYIGSFPLDGIPNIQQKPATLIVNTDPSTKPGQHWVAIFLPIKGKGIFFDSYGKKPVKPELLNFLNSECPGGWIYNNFQLQSKKILALTCGHYCALFCWAMSNNISLRQFIRKFTRNQELNDIITSLALMNSSCLTNRE